MKNAKIVKKLLMVLSVFVLMFGLCCATAQAADNVKVTVDGKPVVFTDAKPFIDSNYRTQVPMRALGEALGCEVYYDAYEGDEFVTLVKTMPNGLDKSSFYIVGSEYYSDTLEEIATNLGEMDTVPIMINNRTYLPARPVAEAFGYDITYNESAKTVVITTPAQKNPLYTMSLYKEFNMSDLAGSVWEFHDWLNNEDGDDDDTITIISANDSYITYRRASTNKEETYQVELNRNKGMVNLVEDGITEGQFIFDGKNSAFVSLPNEDVVFVCGTMIRVQ